MLNYIIRRALTSLPILFGVVAVGFLLMKSVPIDAARVAAGPDASEAEIAQIRERLGLDRSAFIQFGVYLTRLVQLDLGRSVISNRAVSDELSAAIVPTVELMVASFLWAGPLGILLGTLAAKYRRSIVDRLVVAISVMGVSVPVFWVGLMLIQFVGETGAFPFQGRGGPIWTWDGLRHLALPAITLGSMLLGPIARMTRAGLVEVLSADFIRTARAKGADENRVVFGHALRNAMIPVVTLIGIQIGYLLGGAVVTETMFAWPGVGGMAVTAIFSNDYAVAQGAILLLALGFLIVNLIVDVLYALIDPRIKLK